MADETTSSPLWDPTPDQRRWSSADWFLLLGVLALCAFWIGLRYQRDATPIEDASMLLRYAENFSRGHGIRWNVGDPPVDGATDFLFTVAIGALARLTHIGVIAACRILILLGHAASVAVIFVAGRRLLGGNRWVCAAMAAYLCAGPATKMALGCFGAPFFAAMLLGCWCAVLWYAQGSAQAQPSQSSWWRGIVVGLCGLLAGLTRPEGVLITAILLLGLTVLVGRARALRAWIAVIGVFLLLGLPYFLWRWHYFGYPLPNPFYIKGNGHLYFHSVTQAAVNVAVLLAPVLPLLPLGFLQKKTERLAAALTTVLVCFVLMWVLLNNWNNAFMRFQYAVVPLALLTIPALVSGLELLPAAGRWPRRSLRLGSLAASLAVLVSMSYIDREFRYTNDTRGMRAFAERLAPLAAHGDTLAVTEAGALPLFSGWRAIDGLGLNDAYIAHHGGLVSEPYLDRVHPDVILVHVDDAAPRDEYLTELFGGPPVPGSPWENFEILLHYARTHAYTLEAAYGSSPCNLHMYWVRPGFADKDAFVHALRDSPYIFLDNGEFSHDFRNELAACK